MIRIKNRIIYSLCALTLATTSCNKDVNLSLDGDTAFDEHIDYSSFMAKIADSFVEKTINTRADAISLVHIGYKTSEYPNLSVVCDNGDILKYTYSINDKKYILDEGQQIKGKALYMYNSEIPDNGAVIAALWPSEFIANTTTPIDLKNMKSRVSISYKYKIGTSNIGGTSATDELKNMTVSIGKVNNSGEFKTGNQNDYLQYLPKDNSEEVEILATQVKAVDGILDKATENSDNYITGSYEAFVIPQMLDSYEDYIKFNYTLNGEPQEKIYYLKNSIQIEPNNLYKLIFEVEKNTADGTLSFEIADQDVINEWEIGSDKTMEIDPDNPILSEWDGETVEDFSVGDGSVDNPYQIKNANNLAFLCKQSGLKVTKYMNANYKLMINIDWKKGNFTPIGQDKAEFKGVFDGNGKLVKNVNISASYNNQGFFGTLFGTVKNLKLRADVVAVPIVGKPELGQGYGGVCGNLGSTGIIENCYFSGTVTANGKAGGIAGVSFGGTIVGCVVNNSVIKSIYDENNSNSIDPKKVGYSGGIVGWIQKGSVTYNLIQNSEITGFSVSTGAIAGSINSWTAFSNCYAHNITTKSPNKIYGVSAPGKFQIKSCYHDYADGIDDTYYRNHTELGGQQLANILNAMDPENEFVPSDDTKWYWKSSNNELPVPTYWPTEKNK